MRAAAWVVPGVLLAALAARPSAAYFEDVAVDSRGIAMGRSMAATSGDVAAYYWNPAGLAGMHRHQLLLDYGLPYAVPDLSASGIAVGTRIRETGIAAAWHRTAIAGAYGEDLFVLAAGREALALGGHGIDAGAALKLGRVAFEPFHDPTAGVDVAFGSQARGSFDLGLRWRTPWRLDVAWMGRDAAAPRYELVAGSGGMRVPFLHELAASYRWRPDVTLAAGWSEIDATRATHVNLGIEVWFYQVFALRSGFSDVTSIPDATTISGTSSFTFTGGFGVRHRGWHVDAAAATHPVLGASYRASLRIESRSGEAP